MKLAYITVGIMVVAMAASVQGTIVTYGYGSGYYYPSYGAQVSVGYYNYPSYYYSGYYYPGYHYGNYGYYNYPSYYGYYNYPYYGYSYGSVYCHSSCHWVSGYCYC